MNNTKKEISTNQLDISFNMVKQDFADFTDDEIEDFTNEFIQLVENHNYLVGGSIRRNGDDSWEDDDIDSSGIGGELSEEDSIAFSEYLKQYKENNNEMLEKDSITFSEYIKQYREDNK